MGSIEYKSFIMNRRNISRKASTKQNNQESSTPILNTHKENQGKINELHEYMKSYFNEAHQKKVDVSFPKIKQLQSQIKEYQLSIHNLNIDTLSLENRKTFLEKKNHLISKIKSMASNLEKIKSQIQTFKFQRQNVSQEIRNKKEILCRISKYQNGEKPETASSNFKLPSILIQKQEKRKVSSTDKDHKTRKQSILFIQQTPKETAIKDILYEEKVSNSKFEKWKQIETLLNLVSNELPTQSLQNRLCGDKSISIGKKLFKDFSIDLYFRELLKDGEVKKQIRKIKQFLKLYD